MMIRRNRAIQRGRVGNATVNKMLRLHRGQRGNMINVFRRKHNRHWIITIGHLNIRVVNLFRVNVPHTGSSFNFANHCQRAVTTGMKTHKNI